MAALVSNPYVAGWSGQVAEAASLAEHDGFTNLDGRRTRLPTLAEA